MYAALESIDFKVIHKRLGVMARSIAAAYSTQAIRVTPARPMSGIRAAQSMADLSRSPRRSGQKKAAGRSPPLT
jgi:hypothetical protein